MADYDPGAEIEILRSQVAALEELLNEQERTVEEQSLRLVATREKALEATHAKSDFLARMSHELRTPLNSVIGFSNILLKNKAGNLLPQDHVYLERIRENGVHLLELINTILDLSKIEAQRMDVERVPVEIAGLLRETVAQLQSQVEGRDLELALDCPPEVAAIDTDPKKLKQVVINLVGNALKFTQQGRVTVRVVVDEKSRRPTKIAVADTGIGIPPDKLATIFDAFEQVDGSTSREAVGTGLGLSISKSLCELMGYGLEAESVPGTGSVFRVVLAGAEDGQREGVRPAETARPAPPAPVPPPAKGLTVLVIDDEADSRLLLTEQLEALGAQVITVGSGEEGLRVAGDRKPDLITLDIMMPRMDGWKVLRQLKRRPRLRDIPVVVVSMSGPDRAGSLLGAIDYLNKPVRRDELSAVLARVPHRPVHRALVVDDDADACEVLRGYLEEGGLIVTVATNGRAALEAIRSFSPDLITLDLAMPEMDGPTFIRELRKDERFLDVPVVVISARELSAAEAKRLSSQTQAVLQKGERVEEDLRKVLRSVLGARKAPS